MSENRFEGGLDLDESFGADYVAKKQGDQKDGYVAVDMAIQPVPDYITSQLYGQGYATQVLQSGTYGYGPNTLGTTGAINPLYQGGLGAYGVGSAVSSTLNPYSGEVIDWRIERDYARDDYVVTETLRNGQQRRYRVSRQEYADDRYGKYLR